MVNAQKKKILVIDDSETNLLLLRVVLEDEGYEVELMNDSRKAVDYISRHDPDLVLLDLLMPGMDGFEFMGQLKDTGVKGRFPVLVVTAYDSPDNMQKAKALGAADVINKPIDIPSFINKVESIVN
ncbi:MAG TPA: response regulator [Bacteroidales bacterium]|nr:response regulator [Bacteroidales bacterium]